MNNKDLVKEITNRIAIGAKPEKIILFGSFATGAQKKDSDIDLLVIKESSTRRDERDLEIRKLLKDIIYPMDIFVYTPKEAEELKKTPGSFVKKIFLTGKIVYERKRSAE